MTELANLRNATTEAVFGTGGPRVHESIFRSVQLLKKVQQLLEQKPPVPPNVILEIIEDVLSAPPVVSTFDE